MVAVNYATEAKNMTFHVDDRKVDVYKRQVEIHPAPVQTDFNHPPKRLLVQVIRFTPRDIHARFALVLDVIVFRSQTLFYKADIEVLGTVFPNLLVQLGLVGICLLYTSRPHAELPRKSR